MTFTRFIEIIRGPLMLGLLFGISIRQSKLEWHLAKKERGATTPLSMLKSVKYKGENK